VPFRGAWTPLMNEYFASTADVHRILSELPEEADRLPAADSRAKDFVGSCARLARMIGRDAGEAEDWEWRNLAAFFADAQLRAVQDAALQVTSATRLSDGAPVVAAGTGRFLVAKIAARLGRSVEPWEKSIPAEPSLGAIVSDCAPAVAVGLLLSAQGSPP
jgi:(4-(4-[2-(gamma-L-glutamylamino)ethyl]phenoxymethyl)furan-2-yl)methanamine synthase